MSPFNPERQRALSLLKRYGCDPTSFQILERGLRLWFEGEAVIGFAEAAGAWITVGPPVCPLGAEAQTLRAFSAAARAADRRVGLFGLEPALIERLRGERLRGEGLSLDGLKIGARPDWRPAEYHVDGPQRRGLRAQLNRARNKGVTVERLSPEALQRRRPEIERLIARWQAHQKMSVMGFMVDTQPFFLPEARRSYIAERQGALVGFLAAVPIYARRGVFLEDVIRDPRAPNGAVELLIDHALRDAAAEGDTFATLGLAPLADLEHSTHPILSGGLRLAKRLDGLYGFESLRRFKARMRPDAWTPQYLVALDGSVDVWLLYAVLSAFAGGQPLRFGLETLRRQLTPTLLPLRSRL